MDIIKIPSPVKANLSGYNPKEVIIHAHGEYLYYKSKWYHFLDFQDYRGLSAHYWITPSGVIIERVSPNKVAWHAKGVNKTSIGIEFIVPGAIKEYKQFTDKIQTDWVSPEQFKAGVYLVNSLGLPIRRHSDQAPDRKVDPGTGFPFALLQNETGCS